MPSSFWASHAPPAGTPINPAHELSQLLRVIYTFSEGAGSIRPSNTNTKVQQSTTGSVNDKIWVPGRAKRTGYTTRSVMRHTATTAQENLGLGTDILGSASLVDITIAIGYRKTDASNRASTAFGLNASTFGERVHVHLPFSDGTVYWDWGGNSGSNRVSVGGLTFGNDIWVFTGGRRGMEIWQNGILRAVNTGVPTRTVTATQTFHLGNTPNDTAGDLAEFDYFAVWGKQLSFNQIRQLSAQPFAMFSAGPQFTIPAEKALVVTTDASIAEATKLDVTSTAVISTLIDMSVTSTAAIETTNNADVTTDASILHADKDITSSAAISTTVPDDREAPLYNMPGTYAQPPTPISADIIAIDQAAKKITVEGDIRGALPAGATFQVTGSTGNDGTYTVVSTALGSTIITVLESIPSPVADGSVEAMYGHNYALFGLKCDTRIIVGLDPPKFTQEQQDTMGGTELSPYAWHMQWAKGGPRQTGGFTELRSYGVPLFEWFCTAESYGWFPYSREFPFACEFEVQFPETDPVYSVPIIVPGLDNSLGDLNDPLLIYQQGSASSLSAPATVPSANDGNIRIFCNGTDVANIVNDQAVHTVRYEWDPGLTTNAYKYRVLWDGTPLTESQTNIGAAPNTKCHFGWSWHYLTEWDGSGTGDIIPAPGSTSSPTVVCRVGNFKTTQLGTQGYEVYDDPPWTTPNVSGTNHDDSAIGEIHTQDNMRWAIMPRYLHGAVEGDWGRNIQVNQAVVDLIGRLNDPDQLLSFTWIGRPILIDVRQTDGADYTAFRRMIAGYIKATSPSYTAQSFKQTLNIASMPEDKLHTYLTHTWTGRDLDVPGISASLTFATMWGDMLDISEANKGPIPTVSDRIIRDLDVELYDIGSGGQDLLSIFSETIDKAAYEYLVDYTTTGSARHGRVNVHAGTLGSGTPDYTIPTSKVMSFAIHENQDEGPSQAIYRQDNPEAFQETDIVNTWGMPFVGLHPTVPFPATSAPLSDSLAFAKTLQSTALQGLKDKSNVNVTGGIAQHRFRMQAAKRRQATLEVQSLDFINPCHEIAVEAVLCLPNETWIVDSVHWSVSEGKFQSRVEATTSLYVDAIKRTL